MGCTMGKVSIREEEYLKAKTFVSRLLDGMTEKQAARQAGYSQNIDTVGLLDRVEIRQLLVTMMRDRLHTMHAPKALKYMSDTLKDREAAPRLRFDCAKHLLALAGFQAPKVIAEKQTDYGAPSEMSSTELQATIDRLQSEIGQRVTGAKLITLTVDDVDIFS